MFHSSTCLPHLLRPSDYGSNEQGMREYALMQRTWHVVGTTLELANDGDFLTTTIAAWPYKYETLLVRFARSRMSARIDIA